MKEAEDNMLIFTVIFLVGSILISAMVGWMTTRSIRHPVVALSEAAVRVA